MNLENYIRDIQDFPKQGIEFKDITPLLSNPEATSACLELLVSTLADKNINKVIGVESRGFFFGILLAQKLNAGFVPVRKPKKLPFETISASYELEYGTDTLEMHIYKIKKRNNRSNKKIRFMFQRKQKSTIFANRKTASWRN